MKCIRIEGRRRKGGAFDVTSTEMWREDSRVHDAWNTIYSILKIKQLNHIALEKKDGFRYTFPITFVKYPEE